MTSEKTSESPHEVFPLAQECNETQISQYLELLADFVADVAIGGMERGEVGFEGIGVGEREILFMEGANEIENIEGPTAHFGAQF
ncbi:MAG: hypothetical protein WA020_14115, partial [Candidatus Acidiferrales bacterium]